MIAYFGKSCTDKRAAIVVDTFYLKTQGNVN